MKSEDPDLDRLLRMTLRDRQDSASAACLDAERLAAWSAGALAGDEAVAAELHLSNCARCQAMLATFAQTEPPVAAPEPFWRRLSMAWLIPVTAAAALMIWLAIPARTPVPVPETSTARVEPPPAPPRTAPAVAAPEPQNARTPAAPPPAAKAQDELRQAAAPVPSEPVPAATPAPPAVAPAAPATAFAPAAPVDAVRQADQQAQGVVGGLAGGRVGQGQGAVALNRAAVVTQVVEFASPSLNESVTISGASPVVGATGGPAAGGGGAGAAGRGGGRGGPAARAQAPSSAEAVALSTRWRILPGGNVERSVTNGAVWEPVPIDPPGVVTGGVAPSVQVCWLIGRGGIVLRTTNRLQFERVAFPQATDLSSIRATDALQASVTTADGRVFTTTDGGATWR